jgi:hypothetical protein
MGSREIWDKIFRLFRPGISVIHKTVKECSVYEPATVYATRAIMTTVLEVKNVGICLHNAPAVEEFMKRINVGIIAVRFALGYN